MDALHDLHDLHDTRLAAVALDNVKSCRERGGYSDEEHNYALPNTGMTPSEPELLPHAPFAVRR